MDDFLGFFTCLLIGLPCGLAMLANAVDALIFHRGTTLLRWSVILLCAPAGTLMVWGSLSFCHSYLIR